MGLSVNVAGGTKAGSKILKQNPPWTCACPKEHPGHRYSCGVCGTRRAEALLDLPS